MRMLRAKVPADGLSAADKKQDFDTSRWQLSDHGTPLPVHAVGAERNVSSWHDRKALLAQINSGLSRRGRATLTAISSVHASTAALQTCKLSCTGTSRSGGI
jgi:hypothetical protein